MSSNDSGEKCVMHAKSGNIEIMIGKEQVINL